MKLQKHFINIIKKKSHKDVVKILQNMAYFGFEPKVIFDIGANIGMYSLFFAEELNDKVKIYAFEPVTDTYNVLINNINLNKFSNISAYNFGFHRNEMIVELGIPKERESENVGLYTCKHDGEIKDVVKCKMIRMVDFINENGISNIDLIKIDVEGCELDILDSSKDILNKINFVHLEVNTFFKDNLKVCKFLEDNNFSFVRRTRKMNQLWRNDNYGKLV